jgi:aminopeptidase N
MNRNRISLTMPAMFPPAIPFPLLSITVLAFFVFNIAAGQEPGPGPSGYQPWMKAELQRYEARFKALESVASEDRIDVKYYVLDLTVQPSPPRIDGIVTMTATSLVDGLSSITLDLVQSLVISQVLVNDTSVAYYQAPGTFEVTLNRVYNAGETITVRTTYGGTPGSRLKFSTTPSGAPWICSLSEPFYSKHWWPCKDHPSDKADSIDISVTVPAGLKVGSNGRLVDVVTGNPTTYHWHHGHPISTYLVSISISNYSEFTDWFRYSPTDSMPVLNYILPEHLGIFRDSLKRTKDMLQIYSDLFGLYPFIDEKYGHSEHNWGYGGMEHQTMTSFYSTTYDRLLIAHELAHQWFGDMITLQTWPHIWLNEGMAQYSTYLCEEKVVGPDRYRELIDLTMPDARTAVGTLYRADSTNLFGWALVYVKGSMVPHMLRRVVGDSLFFESMRVYALDTALMYGNAVTEDFQGVFESVTGKNLGYFFNEWIYGEKYPQYTHHWSVEPDEGGFLINLSVSQSTGTSNPAFFTMPLDVRLAAPGWDTTVVLFNNAQSQTFSFGVSHLPATVELDPGNWILKTGGEAVPPVGPPIVEIKIVHPYVTPGSGAALLRARIKNPLFHALSVTAYIELDATVIDSAIFYDDGLHSDSLAGDGLWGATWSPPAGEVFYTVGIATYDSVNSSRIDLTNLCPFTTAGPVDVDSMVTTQLTPESVKVDLWLRNVGAVKTFSSVRAALRTTSPAVKSFVSNYGYFGGLAPGQRNAAPATYVFTVDTTVTCADIPFSVDISSAMQVYWTPEIVAYVGTRAVVDRGAIDYGILRAGESKIDTIYLSNTNPDTLNILSAETDHPGVYAVSPSSAMILPNDSAMFVVTFHPTSFGWYPAHLILITDVECSNLIVDLMGILAPDHSRPTVSDTAVHYGGVFRGSGRTDSVVLRNPNALPLTVASIVSDLPEQFSVSPSSATIDPVDSLTVRITFHPTAPGEYAGHITLTHDAEGTPVVVEVTGTGRLENVQIGIAAEWNIVSVPMAVDDRRQVSLFPGSTSRAYHYGNGYHPADTLTPGEGYWVKYSAPETLEIAGTMIDHQAIPVNRGWNLLGSISTPTPVSTIGSDPPGIVTTGFYCYLGNGLYELEDTIKPGCGYWVKAGQAGELILSATAVVPAVNRIRIESTSELPPPPPDGGAVVTEQTVPTEYRLEQNYPNPFNPVTSISYALPVGGYVRLSVFNIVGQEVAVLVDGEQRAGYGAVAFDAGKLPSGVYIYKIVAEGFTGIRRMLLLK